MKPIFYGSSSMGDKRQVSIPAKACEELELKQGDELIVLSGPRKNVLMLIKPEKLQDVAAYWDGELTKSDEDKA